MRENGRSKGYGFVCFDTVDEAFSAFNQMKREVLGSKLIYVEFFKRKQKRSQSVGFQLPSRTIAQPRLKPVNTSNNTTAFPRLCNRLRPPYRSRN